MKKCFVLFGIVLLGSLVGGCSHLKQDSVVAQALRDRLEDYHQSATLPPLKIPQGMVAASEEDAMPIPE